MTPAAATAASEQSIFRRSVPRQQISLAQGNTGVAFGCGYLDSCFAGDGWDRTAHRYLASATREGLPGLSVGMFDGLAGLGLTACSLSRGGTRYQRFLAELDAALFPQVLRQAESLLNGSEGRSNGEFDAISGLAGVGIYLLRCSGTPSGLEVLERTLDALITLAGHTGHPRRWWTPPQFMGERGHDGQYAYGSLNCGLAHGMPGPIAFMSVALRSGIERHGLAEAIDRSASWLTTHRTDDEWGDELARA